MGRSPVSVLGLVHVYDGGVRALGVASEKEVGSIQTHPDGQYAIAFPLQMGNPTAFFRGIFREVESCLASGEIAEQDLVGFEVVDQELVVHAEDSVLFGHGSRSPVLFEETVAMTLHKSK
ncbi:MAG: hypothetical protein AAGN66_25645 [Acidobacteriota bacterium]